MLFKESERRMKSGLTIGELAREVRLNPKTIRYYEEIGLLSKPRRSESGYRLYSEYEAGRLMLVRRAKILGLSLAEIKELVDYAIDGHCNTLERRLLSLVEAKLVEIDQKIMDLNTFREDLTRYRRDLSKKLESACNEAPTPGSCRCIGEEASG